MESMSSSAVKNIHRGAEIVLHVLGIFEIFLIFRFFLKLLGANPEAVFTKFIYQITYAFAYPFLNVFPSQTVDGKVFEWSTLLAMLIYWLIALGIIQIFFLGKKISGLHVPGTAGMEDKKRD